LAIDAFIVIGTPVSLGFLQWLILRERFANVAAWKSATGIGGVSGFIGFILVSSEWIGATVAAALGGALVGALQWLVLRRCVAHSGWWVLVSSIGWIVAAWMYLFVMNAGVGGLPIGGAFSGFACGAITGAGLVWLLRRPNDARPPRRIGPGDAGQEQEGKHARH
jgi:hypothetical protein